MSEGLFSTALFARLQKLSGHFVWKRTTLQEAITSELQDVQARHTGLQGEQQAALQRITHLESDCTRLQQQVQLGKAALTVSEEAGRALKNELDSTVAKHTRETRETEEKTALITRHRDGLKREKDLLTSSYEALHNQLVASQSEVATQQSVISQLQQDLAHEREALAHLNKELDDLRRRHGDTWRRFSLVSSLLAAEAPANAGLSAFRSILAQDYMHFAELESSLAAEAAALKMLQSIEQDVSLMAGFPDIYARTIVGIVGGFSSGKSEFINSFIDDRDVRLAVGLSAVTVIPSYVLSSKQTQIRGFSVNGGYIDLKGEEYNGISHAFLDTLSFDLKRLMPFMCVDIPMTGECFEHICFVDTPGYNAPGTVTNYSNDDRATAVTFARKTDALIWLIGLDANGTIPDSDLQFIKDIDLGDRSLHVVLNKADLRADEELDAVLDTVEYLLSLHGIHVTGISAYSSIHRELIKHRGTDLMSHFSALNHPADVIARMSGRIQEVFRMYTDAIGHDLRQARRMLDARKSLPLDALEIGGPKLLERVKELADGLGDLPDIDMLEQHLAEAKRLERAFIDAVELALRVQRAA